MQNFHIYEEIGEGTGSVVYKGRKKQEIEFVAVKRVAKEYKQRVLNEVSVLYNFNHPNILRFINWYETRNHIWIIEEYCAGGDLYKLLSEDKKLPEWSIRDFAKDIIYALHYVHSEGYLYCDLKPSNLVLLEDGQVKLCDFGLSRPVDDEAEGDVEGGDEDGEGLVKGQPRRGPTRKGTPYYMAPELFHTLGVHSYATDMWSLGCLLYEMATGKTPFYCRTLEKLIQKIGNDQVSPVPGFSKEFTDLLHRLLQKDPLRRMTWDVLLTHPWIMEGEDPEHKTFYDLDPSMPEQPKFQEMIRNLKNQGVIRRQPGPNVRESLRLDAADVLRLSINAKRNLDIQTQRNEDTDGKGDEEDDDEPHKQSYSRKSIIMLTAEGQAELEASEKKKMLEKKKNVLQSGGDDGQFHLPLNTDVELNFNDEEDGAVSSGTTQEDEKASSPGAEDESDSSPLAKSPDAEDIAAAGVATAALDQQAQVGEGAAEEEDAEVEELDTKEIFQLLRNQTDMRNGLDFLVDNAHIKRKPAQRKYHSKSIPFSVLSKAQMASLTEQALHVFVEKVLKAMDSKKTAASQKTQILHYLASMCTNDTNICNIFSTPDTIRVMVGLIKNGHRGGAMVRGLTLDLIGTLMRYTTVLDEEVLSTGILEALADQIRDSDVRLKRAAAAALGELLFYIATKQENDVGIRDSLDGWHVKPHIIKTYMRCLRATEDEKVSHYAVQCMLNVCSQSPVSWFVTNDVVTGAYTIYNKTRTRHLRAACAILIGLVTTRDKSMMGKLIEKLGISPISTGLQEASPKMKIQHAFLDIFNFALYFQIPRLSSLIRAHPTILRSLMRVFEKASGSRKFTAVDIVIAAKVLCCLCMLGDLSATFLLECFEHKLASSLNRVVARFTILKKEKLAEAIDRLQRAFAVFESRCQRWSQNLAIDIMSSIQSQAARRNLPTRERKAMKTQISKFPVILEFVNCQQIRESIVDSNFVQLLSELIATSKSTSFPGDDTFRETLLSIVEAISQSARLLLDLNQSVLKQLLPALVSMLTSTSSTIRFLSLKVLSDILIQLFRPASESIDGNIKRIQTLTLDVIHQLIPQYKAILKDQEAITAKGLKLLNTLVEIDSSIVQAMTKYGITSHLIEYFQAKHMNNSLHTVQLLGSIIKADDPPDYMVLRLICQQHNLTKSVSTLLRQFYKFKKEWFYQPLLEIIHCLLMAAAGLKEDEDGKMVSAKASQAATKALLDQLRPMTEVISLIMELVLVGTSPSKQRKPSIVQIGISSKKGSGSRTVSRAGTSHGVDSQSSLNSHTQASVRSLATTVLWLLVEMYPSSHNIILSQANLGRMSAGLIFATRHISQTRSAKIRNPELASDLEVQRNLLRAAYIAVGNDAKRAQILSNFCSKNSQFMRVLQDASQKYKAADSHAQKYAASLCHLISRRANSTGTARRVNTGRRF